MQILDQSISTRFEPANWAEGFEASTAGLFAAVEGSLEISEHILGAFPDLFEPCLSGGIELVADAADFCSVEVLLPPAGRAGEVLTFSIAPSQRYLELFAAVAGERDVERNVSHGWPILSLGDRTPSVAEGAGESILGAGGRA